MNGLETDCDIVFGTIGRSQSGSERILSGYELEREQLMRGVEREWADGRLLKAQYSELLSKYHYLNAEAMFL